MEVSKKVKVSNTYFYDRVIESVLYDVRTHTDKSLNMHQLENLEYHKKFSASQSGTMKITKIVPGELYAYELSTNRNKYTVSYEVKAIDADHCEVTYKEKVESFGTMQKMNDMLVGIVLGFMRKKNIKRTIEAIEASGV